MKLSDINRLEKLIDLEIKLQELIDLEIERMIKNFADKEAIESAENELITLDKLRDRINHIA